MAASHPIDDVGKGKDVGGTTESIESDSIIHVRDWKFASVEAILCHGSNTGNCGPIDCVGNDVAHGQTGHCVDPDQKVF